VNPVLHGGDARTLWGSPYVTDALTVAGHELVLRRHVLAFFQGNRYLLLDLVDHVTALIPEQSSVVDLYAGVGLFAIGAAVLRQARVTAIEGDRVAARDLAANSEPLRDRLLAMHQPVETFVGSGQRPEVVIVDPPRTGMSRAAIEGTIGLGAHTLVYVSCDVATLARDARRLLDAGYGIRQLDAFDLFPNTPHVETVMLFQRGG
jgi:23S rRNA (uracil1939-C5)-methyltransferase